MPAESSGQPGGTVAAPPEGVRTERGARAAWSRLTEPGDPVTGQVVARYGAVDGLRRLLEGEELTVTASSMRPRDPALHAVLRRWRAGVHARAQALDVERDLQMAARAGAAPVVPGDALWPPGVDDLPVPPVCLWVRGRAGPGWWRRSVAVVGARSCTSYGQHVAADLSADLAASGVPIVSGAAFGIDAAAHEGALAADGTTVAVLAGGVERAYPAAHADLIERIADAGLVISEVAPGGAPRKHRFLTRNRLIAAMTGGTVVVEAGIRSGALSTARHARDLCRPVAVVPGPVTSMSSAGCHQAVREGYAVLVTDAAEVLELMTPLGEMDRPGRDRPETSDDPEASDDLDDEGRSLRAVLPDRRATSPDALARAAGMETRDVLSQLGRMEALGLAERTPTGWRRVTSTRSRELGR